MQQNYKPLIAGDVREPDDEVRKMYCGWNGGAFSTSPPNPGPWEKVYLVGHAILPIDFANAEFRRPC